MYVDTHCHIHTADAKREDHTVKKWHEAGEISGQDLLKSAKAGHVSKMICVGTDYEDSVLAADFASQNEGCFSSIGVHPHEAKDFLRNNDYLANLESLVQSAQRAGKLVAIGEIGLDYYYEHSPRKTQIKLLEILLDLAQNYSLPVIFHVREAFDDFWPLIKSFKIEGVLHSFTSNEKNMDKALDKGFYIGLNGIMTFTKDQDQLNTAKKIPLDRLLLETDAPYLTPKPMRGKVCKPEYISYTYDFLSELRGENRDKFISQVESNASALFGI